MEKKLSVVVILVLVLVIIGLFCARSSIAGNANIEDSARQYLIVDPATFDYKEYFRVMDVRITQQNDRPILTISGKYRLEFLGWKYGGLDEIADDIYKQIIPGLAKRIGEIYREKTFDLDFDFSIVVLAYVVKDKNQARAEAHDRARNRGFYQADRDFETIIYVIPKEAAFDYSKFKINNSTLRDRIAIIAGDERVR